MGDGDGGKILKTVIFSSPEKQRKNETKFWCFHDACQEILQVLYDTVKFKKSCFKESYVYKN